MRSEREALLETSVQWEQLHRIATRRAPSPAAVDNTPPCQYPINIWDALNAFSRESYCSLKLASIKTTWSSTSVLSTYVLVVPSDHSNDRIDGQLSACNQRTALMWNSSVWKRFND
ncbi:hypothetical protein KGM_210082 [Danaus plexippus plexippus]|uniref:Uncharacterized protein n=1 Tax=Danaus plexippus plexippus TaxID=278856 RepID=A0A212ETC3_DANPL|nr:hypothetical protein KGM_210082 [Danaus plexippus plexippus]